MRTLKLRIIIRWFVPKCFALFFSLRFFFFFCFFWRYIILSTVFCVLLLNSSIGVVFMHVWEVSILLPFATECIPMYAILNLFLMCEIYTFFILHPQCRHHAQVHVSSALDGESERSFYFMLHLIIAKVSNELPLTAKKKKKKSKNKTIKLHVWHFVVCFLFRSFFPVLFFFFFRFIILAFNFAYLYYFRIEKSRKLKTTTNSSKKHQYRKCH